VTTTPARAALRFDSKIIFALLTVYLIWGSTYLALRFALESFPPFLLGGVRYLLAGLILYAYARRTGSPAPSAREWRSASVLGFLFFALGNGLVGVAQAHSISSGVAAIVVATTSLWAVIFSSFWGVRPRARELFGLLLGLLGIALLQREGSFAGSLPGFCAIVIAPMAWALGAVWSPHLPLPAGSMSSAAEMIAGGLAMLALGLLTGERTGVVTVQATLSFVYLTVFGSLVAFSAFGFLLRHTRPAVATSSAFVNPIVALVLGALLGGEQLTAPQLGACALCALAVLAVLRSRTQT
jgi:drug/metabolite transporter (DMT)-like permease